MSSKETTRLESNRETVRLGASDGAKQEGSGDPVGKGKRSKHSSRILLVPYPKFVFMYPTFIVATVSAIVLFILGFSAVNPETDTVPLVLTGVFLMVLLLNTLVIVFDFPRATSLTLVFIAISVILAVWMLGIVKGDLLPTIHAIVTSVQPAANAAFFGCITLGMLLMYIAIFIKVRFDYWEVSNNELLHHHGFLSDLKRFPAPNLRVDKEINDVFEYLLLGAGRLILHPSSEKRAIVLDNVLFVSKKERQLTRTLGSIKVKIGEDSGEDAAED